jgi:hypothetical protein
MYASQVDNDSGLLVGLFAGHHQADADFDRVSESLNAADRNATARSLTLIFVLVVDREAEQPSPSRRRAMAENNKRLTAARYLFAFVTPNTVLRGILTAVRWLTGERTGHEVESFASPPEAFEWVRRMTGQAYPQLEALYDRARKSTLRSTPGRPTV